jgi:hypothetical protein
MKTLALVTSVLVTVGGLAATAEAAPWGGAAPGCQIDLADVSIAAIDTLNGVVGFSGSNTGTINLACPVTSHYNTAWDTIRLTFNEQDPSTDDSCEVTAYLQRVKNNGSFSGSTVTSVGSGTATRNGFASVIANFTHTLDENYYYWVYYVISRPNTNCSPLAYGVYLYDAP